ncbi:hypothetical protein ACET3Z_001302 [Daucus carota]
MENTVDLKEAVPHIVCMPFPGQGHITPMLTLAKLLHNRGFYITFVHTDFSYRRSLRSHSPVGHSDTFRFETIPDGLPPPESPDDFPHVIQLCVSTSIHSLSPFRDLVTRLNNSPDVPPVTCIISDATMSFTLDVSQELGIPNIFFWTVNAFTLMCYLHFSRIRNLASQLRQEAVAGTDVKNGHLDHKIDWLPGMGVVRLRDTSSMIWEPALPDCFVEYCMNEISRTYKASAVILNTFDALESEIVKQISAIIDRDVYCIGPIHSLINSVKSDENTKSIKFNLWKEDSGCVEWLDSKEAGSVVYVNFGSTTVMSPQHLEEFAWGLANSKQNFLWIIRLDLVVGDSPALPLEFVNQTKGRGLLASWCDQQQVLSHMSIGGFLTHCGWNSTLESLSAGVPMICWPFFADQLCVRHCVCKLWRVGIEVDEDVQRDGVEKAVRELMEEDNGKEMKNRALEWKGKSETAILSSCSGSSNLDLDRLVNEVILSHGKRS